MSITVVLILSSTSKFTKQAKDTVTAASEEASKRESGIVFIRCSINTSSLKK